MSSITPHLGYVSEQNYRKYFPDIVEDIRAWLDGKPVRVVEAKSTTPVVITLSSPGLIGNPSPGSTPRLTNDFR